MEEKGISQDVIRSVMFYALIKGWDANKLKEVYEYLELPEELVNETLNEGIDC